MGATKGVIGAIGIIIGVLAAIVSLFLWAEAFSLQEQHDSYCGGLAEALLDWDGNCEQLRDYIFEITAVAWFICGCGVIFVIIGIILLATSRDINNGTKVMIIREDSSKTTIDGVRSFAGYCTFCGTPFPNSKAKFCSNCGNAG